MNSVIEFPVSQTDAARRQRYKVADPILGAISRLMEAGDFPPSAPRLVRALLAIAVDNPEVFENIGGMMVEEIIAAMAGAEEGGHHE